MFLGLANLINIQMKPVFLLISVFLIEIQVYSQLWPKMYYVNSPNYPFSVIQTYDHGYLIGGKIYNTDGTRKGGFLYKTNINGDLLWHKTFYRINDSPSIFDINQTDDGGYIIAGSNDRTDSWGDPFIMKLNSCGESEWCRIYTVGEGRFDKSVSIEQVPGGFITYVFYGYDLTSNKKVHLYRLDQNGEMIWQQAYGQTDTLMMNGADGYEMRVSFDYHYLISGFCYYPDSGTTDPKYLKPLIIKVDSSGTADWELPWHYVSGESFHGEAYRSILDNQQNIYSCGRHIESSATPAGDRPAMIKTDWEGNEISYHNMVPDSWQAVFYNINWFQDSSIVLDGGWIMTPGYDGQAGAFKVDKNGNILDSVNIQKTLYCFSDAIVDMDNMLFLVQPKYEGNQWRTYAWKLNSDLEYDTLYTQPLVYDSLCPHPIASDTIPLNCIIVGVDEPFQNPETGKLKVYPNPAWDKLHIVIPDQIKTQSNTPVFDLTTVYHQWHSAQVEIYDLFGRKMYSKEIVQPEKGFEVDVSAWQKGLYVVRLVYNGQTVASEKVVIE